MSRRALTLVVGLVSILAVFTVYFGFYGRENKNITKKTEAASGSATLTSQAEWTTGTNTNTDLTTTPGAVKIDVKTASEILGGSYSYSDPCTIPQDASLFHDGNLGTALLLGCTDSWAEWDFGETKQISQVRTYAIEIDTDVATNPQFSIQYWNGSVWTEIAIVNSLSAAWETHDISPPVNGSKIRYVLEMVPPGSPDETIQFDETAVFSSASATHTSAAAIQLDAGAHSSMNWTTFVPSGTIPANTSINFRFRTSADAATWGSWTASTPYAASIDIGTLLGATDKTKRYLQVETTLANTDGASTPTLNAYTANYTYQVFDHLTISPDSTSLTAGGNQTFTASAIGDDGNPMAGATFSWTASCGSAPANGNPITYTAPTTGGTTCQLSVTSNYGGSATANIIVNSPPTPPPFCEVDRITITPTPAVININQGITFAAKLYKVDGTLITDGTVDWETSGGTIINNGDDSARYIAPAAPGNYFVKAISCGKSKTLSFSLTVNTPTTAIAINLDTSPDEAYLRPSQVQQYTARVSDQDGNDITSSCPVSWSMQTPAAGSIDLAGKMTATSALGVWNDSVKATANCFGLSDFELMTFVTTNEDRRLDYVWSNPWSANVQDPVRSVQFNVWGYDQFFLRIVSDIDYSFSLLDDRIGTIPSNGRVINIATSKNYGCYPNKIKATAKFRGVEKSAFDSISIFPANYAFGSSNCGSDLGAKIMSAITGADKSYATEGQVFTSVTYDVPKYYRPGQVRGFAVVPRDQVHTPIGGVKVKVEYILKNPNAGQLSSNGQFIATTNLGNYPVAIEIKASQGGKVITKTFGVLVTNEQRKATTIFASGPTGSTELTTSRVLKMWKGSSYSFYSQLRDQFGNNTIGQPYAKIEDVSGKNLVNILGPTTLEAKDTEGLFKNAIKITYDIDRYNQNVSREEDIIQGPSPIRYLTLDINNKNDNPAACLNGKPICDPLDPACVAVCIGDNCDVGCGIFCVIAGIIPDNIMTKTAIVALAVAAFLTLLALLPAALNYWLSYLHFGQLYALFFKGREKKHAAGVVYDSGSGFGIPLAKILLFRARDAKLQAVAISDKNGRFALETPPGEEYFLEIRKEGFEVMKNTFRACRQAGAPMARAGLAFENNYYGGKFLPRDGHYLFDRAIPLIATKESEKFARAVAFSETMSKILRVMNIPILLFSFIVSILAYLVTKQYPHFGR